MAKAKKGILSPKVVEFKKPELDGIPEDADPKFVEFAMKVDTLSRKIIDVVDTEETSVVLASLEMVLKAAVGTLGKREQQLLVDHLNDFHREIAVTLLLGGILRQAGLDPNAEPDLGALDEKDR
jgi:hypothetical protein